MRIQLIAPCLALLWAGLITAQTGLSQDQHAKQQLLGWHAKAVLETTRCADCHVPDSAVVDQQSANQVMTNALWAQIAAFELKEQEARQENAKDLKPTKVSDYWIGIASAPAPRTSVKLVLNDNSKLDAIVESGLEVTRVTPNSPAESAGLKDGDVIHRIDGELLSSVDQLVKLIDTAKSSSMELMVIRDAESIRVSVTPQKRPKIQASSDFSTLSIADSWRAINDGQKSLLDLQATQVLPEKLPPNGKLVITLDAKGEVTTKIQWKVGSKAQEFDVFNDKVGASAQPIKDALAFIKKGYQEKPTRWQVQSQASKNGAQALIPIYYQELLKRSREPVHDPDRLERVYKIVSELQEMVKTMSKQLEEQKKE